METCRSNQKTWPYLKPDGLVWEGFCKAFVDEQTSAVPMMELGQKGATLWNAIKFRDAPQNPKWVTQLEQPATNQMLDAIE